MNAAQDAAAGTGNRVLLGKRKEPDHVPRSGISPGCVNKPVARVPSVTRKNSGKRSAHQRFAAGTYCREFASMAATPGTCAAKPAECSSDAPGQVRSCTHKNRPYFSPPPPTTAIAIAPCTPSEPRRCTPSRGQFADFPDRSRTRRSPPAEFLTPRA